MTSGFVNCCGAVKPPSTKMVKSYE